MYLISEVSEKIWAVPPGKGCFLIPLRKKLNLTKLILPLKLSLCSLKNAAILEKNRTSVYISALRNLLADTFFFKYEN